MTSLITRTRLKAFVPAIVWSLIILFLSSTSGINIPSSWSDLFSVDKIGHLIVYALFSVFILYGFYKNSSEKLLTKNNLILAIVLSSFYGILMEIMQYVFFPGRYFENLDIIANIIGSLFGTLFFNFFYLKTE